MFRVFPSQINECCSVDCLKAFRFRESESDSKKAKRRLQSIWSCMKDRCLRKNSAAYDYYGGRGISVCDEWIESSVPFIGWAIDNGYRGGLSLDRRDPNGNYCPENCRWATRIEQSRNTRKRSDAKTSKFKGVSRHSQTGRWVVQLHKGGKPLFCGTFADEIEAAKRYDEMASSIYGEFANLNFPSKECASR